MKNTINKRKSVNIGEKLLLLLLIIIIFTILLSWYFVKNLSQPTKEKAMNEWAGNYEFFEYYPPNINMYYYISVYEENGEYLAKVSVDGFQTNIQVLANLKVNLDSIDFVFNKYLSESSGKALEIDDVLLTFKKEDNNVYTKWGEIQPILPENSEIGIYFVKVSE